MERSALLQLTDIETIKRKYHELLAERVHTDGSHPLYNKGVFDGMEIILTSIAESIQSRLRIADQTAG